MILSRLIQKIDRLLFSSEKIITFAALIETNGMKKDIHPEDYRLVIFRDTSNGYEFLCRSCAPTKETAKYEDGNEYPLVKLEISHKSHPFFTGKMKLVDTAGRVDKFNKRYARHRKDEKKQEESKED